jgi:hypothetical protein
VGEFLSVPRHYEIFPGALLELFSSSQARRRKIFARCGVIVELALAFSK